MLQLLPNDHLLLPSLNSIVDNKYAFEVVAGLAKRVCAAARYGLMLLCTGVT